MSSLNCLSLKIYCAHGLIINCVHGRVMHAQDVFDLNTLACLGNYMHTTKNHNGKRCRIKSVLLIGNSVCISGQLNYDIFFDTAVCEAIYFQSRRQIAQSFVRL